jgi:hypothetical protein
MDRPGRTGEAATALVIGVAVGLFTSVSLLLGVWLAAPFFAPVLLVVLAGSVAAATAAARRLALPRLAWWKIVLAAAVAWPVSATLPYAALVGEVHLRVDLPSLPPDATRVKIQATPLSGGSMHGPAPGIVAEYWTPLSQDAARANLVALLPMAVSFEKERLYAIPDPDQARVVTRPDGAGTRVTLGIYGDYTSALPWLMFLLGCGWIAAVFLLRPPRKRQHTS